MSEQVTLLLLGFALTTVVGGFLGYWFQRRSWAATRRESERQAAVGAFEEISRLMDRRIYRTYRWLWSLKPGTATEARRTERESYVELLHEWNNTVNRNLALAQRYFGRDVGDFLDRVLYEEFKRIGERVTALSKNRDRGGILEAVNAVEEEIHALEAEVYLLNRYVIFLVQQGNIGLYHRTGKRRLSWRGGQEFAPWDIELKLDSRGPSVAAWQRALIRVQGANLAVSGVFDAQTREATIQFQQAHKLGATGVVNSQTQVVLRQALPPVRRPEW